MCKIYSFSLKKGVVLISADYFKQRFNKIVIQIIIRGLNSLHDRIKKSVYLLYVNVYFYRNFRLILVK